MGNVVSPADLPVPVTQTELFDKKEEPKKE
jgi:hypothetical protein